MIYALHSLPLITEQGERFLNSFNPPIVQIICLQVLLFVRVLLFAVLLLDRDKKVEI